MNSGVDSDSKKLMLNWAPRSFLRKKIPMMDLEELEFQHSAFCDPVFAKHPLIANSSFIVTGLFVSAPIFSTITTQ
jgi:hypothetical protein